MVQCEMCGTETTTPKTIKVEGAELDVCDDCADFGTEVAAPKSSDTSTKYSTDSDSSAGGSSSSSESPATSRASHGSTGGGRDMFDDMDELAQDYDDVIREARESEGLSQADLADELNEKASLIRKLERGETLPSDEVQAELERFLDIDLSSPDGRNDDDDWNGDTAPGEYTLGDVVKRED